MGNCTSVDKTTDMKVAVQIESPVKDNTGKMEQHIVGDGFLPQTSSMEHVASFRDLSSKEDLFFDSQPLLESDCEDYFSVNGDLTPSSGSSPIHHKSFIDATQPEKILYMDSASNCTPEPSSRDMKKQLIELFRESFGDDTDDLQGQQQETTKPTIVDLPSKPTSPYESVPNSVCSSGTPAYRGSRPKKDKAAPCCIPSLIRNLSFVERKKRLSSMNTYAL